MNCKNIFNIEIHNFEKELKCETALNLSANNYSKIKLKGLVKFAIGALVVVLLLFSESSVFADGSTNGSASVFQSFTFEKVKGDTQWSPMSCEWIGSLLGETEPSENIFLSTKDRDSNRNTLKDLTSSFIGVFNFLYPTITPNKLNDWAKKYVTNNPDCQLKVKVHVPLSTSHILTLRRVHSSRPEFWTYPNRCKQLSQELASLKTTQGNLGIVGHCTEGGKKIVLNLDPRILNQLSHSTEAALSNNRDHPDSNVSLGLYEAQNQRPSPPHPSNIGAIYKNTPSAAH